MSDDTKATERLDSYPDDQEGPYEYPIKLQVGLTAQKLVAAFGDSGPDDVRTLIMELEQEVGLWALTILLGRYFAGQMEIISRENPELFAMSDEDLMKELRGE